MQKLKVAANSGENPGFDFLQECWDDPALVVVIKKLVANVSAVEDCLCGWGVGEVESVAIAYYRKRSRKSCEL
ncbi:hypothetical protein [Nostoc sp. KVJ20]|uniref:hypothetical protein n=1 Tax=Nostoc sp. KVJ20 TaxID=457944 RepID=UPI00210EABB7|nr:hypothetical protein [Nostoc sp. KVJ20]